MSKKCFQDQKESTKLIEFCVTRTQKNKQGNAVVSSEEEQYCVYGTYFWDEAPGVGAEPFQYPEFEGLQATQVVNGKEIPYAPAGSAWNHKFQVDDMINSALATAIWGATESVYRTLFLHKGLQEFIDGFRSEENCVLSAFGLKIYKYILSSNLSMQYQLDLVTDQYIYYSNESLVYAFSTSDHNLLSDNEYADISYWNSVDAIKNGTEKLLWGELPENN